MKTEKERIEAATMTIAREVCPYYNKGRCDLGSPTCHKTSIQLCSRKEAIIASLNRIVKQAKIDILNELREKYATSGSVNSNWATIIFVDDIDELIKEVEKQ